MNNYRGPMQPWPALAPHARQVHLPRSDLSLYLYDAGPADATPLLLVHGLGDEADTWRHLIPPLSACYRILAPDLPGYGCSDKPHRPYTVPFFKEALVELLDELGERGIRGRAGDGGVRVEVRDAGPHAIVEPHFLLTVTLAKALTKVHRSTAIG